MRRSRTASRADADQEPQFRRILLWVLTVGSGIAAVMHLLGTRVTAWPTPFAFGWCAVFATGLVCGILRRRRARQRAEAAAERHAARADGGR